MRSDLPEIGFLVNVHEMASHKRTPQYARISISIYIYIYIFKLIYIYIFIFILYLYLYLYVYLYLFIYLLQKKCMYIYIYTYMPRLLMSPTRTHQNKIRKLLPQLSASRLDFTLLGKWGFLNEHVRAIYIGLP